MAYAESLGVGTVAQARPEPTTTFGDRLERTVGGRELVLLSTPGGETTDALVVWLPESRTLLSGNLFGPLFGHVPNLVTIRGDRYRDALQYVASLDLVLGLGPERLLTGHFDPIDGADRIAEEITAMRDATQWVHDRTVEGMNAGVDVYTLMREIRNPPGLDVGEGYGLVAWNVRAIWETYAGWFHHRSTTDLYGVPPGAVAPDVVAAAGADTLVAAARKRLAEGEPVAALHLCDTVLGADPDHAGGRVVSDRGARGAARRRGQLLAACLVGPGRRPAAECAVNAVSFDYDGASVLVTGATSGIGNAIARGFAAAGARVTVTGRRASADAYDADLTAFSYHQLETTDGSSVDALVDSLGDLDVLVNNAGANFPDGRDEWEPEAFAAALALNLAGPMRLTAACRSRLAASRLEGGACVVNLASLSAFRSVPIVPGYGSAKAGLVALTGNLARLWVSDGIRVNAVAPGVIDTPMTAPMAALPELLASEVGHIPMGRMGEPDEVVGAVLFLCSAAAGYVTGHTLVVDGGYLLV